MDDVQGVNKWDIVDAMRCDEQEEVRNNERLVTSFTVGDWRCAQNGKERKRKDVRVWWVVAMPQRLQLRWWIDMTCNSLIN